jgi:predicted secreted protein
MNPISLTVVFVVVWWMVFFIALPVGIKRDENPELGNSSGAPKNPNLKIKIIITTIISLVLTGIYFYAFQHGAFDFINVRGMED